jgi:hypothetical protein
MIANPQGGWALQEGTGEPRLNVDAHFPLFDFKGRALLVPDI